MLEENDCQQIIALMKKEIVPAIGCTEPVAVSLCVAKAVETLGSLPDNIQLFLSGNIIKNAMGVGIPGTNMVGLPIAIALGALIGKSEYGLEVLKDLKVEDVILGKKYIDEKRINISLKEDTDELLYIEARCTKDNNTSICTIAKAHTNVIYLEKDGEVLLSKQSEEDKTVETSLQLSFGKAYEFAINANVDDIRFILESARLNKAASDFSQNGNYGHSVSKSINGTVGKYIMGDSIFTRMLSYTAAACDARMDGALIPVMSNSGSGNQGITATLPVLSYAEDTDKDEESLIRALTLSHLTVICIKQKLGCLSALCGCVAAATGASCGITYLMGGDYRQVSFAVKNMIGNITGMICDGAKPSCALKISSGVSTAVLSAIMAVENKVVTSMEGIVDDDVDKTIENLTSIGAKGMQETDKMVLDIMVGKK